MLKYRIASVMLILCVLMVFSVPTAFTAEVGTVCTDKKYSINKKQIETINVQIKNCNNLMGCKLHFDVDDSKIKVIDVVAGGSIKNGSFIHNADLNSKAFDVLWTGSEAIGEDKTLCLLTIEGMSAFNETEIKVSYSQQDTFDEYYADVKLDCENITISGEINEQTTDYQEMTNITDFIQTEHINTITNEILDEVDKNETLSTINSILKKFSISTPEDIKVDNREELIDEFDKAVTGFSKKTNGFNQSEKIKTADELYNNLVLNEQNTSATNDETGTESKIGLLWILIFVGAVVCIIITVILIKRRNKVEKGNE